MKRKCWKDVSSWGDFYLFMESKGEDAKELLDEKWLCEFEFWCEIPVHCGRGSFRGRAMWRGNMWELLKPIWPRGRRRCYKETRVTCFQSMMEQICTAALPITLFVEKLSKQNRALRASFLTLEPRKSSLNFSAIHLQLTVSTFKHTHTHSSTHKLLQCSACLAALNCI